MTQVDEWTFYRGTAETRTITVEANQPLTDEFDVEWSWDRLEWHDAEWIGDEGLTRKLELFVDDAVMPAIDAAPVFVRVNAGAEIPYIKAGQARFR